MNSATVPSPATGRERNDAFAARLFSLALETRCGTWFRRPCGSDRESDPVPKY
ncbi:hypothetical protein NG2371_01070 [Nocardia gamkensis]|nr:hypothetical protein [Nocardia gamkensis]